MLLPPRNIALSGFAHIFAISIILSQFDDGHRPLPTPFFVFRRGQSFPIVMDRKRINRRGFVNSLSNAGFAWPGARAVSLPPRPTEDRSVPQP